MSHPRYYTITTLTSVLGIEVINGKVTWSAPALPVQGLTLADVKSLARKNLWRIEEVTDKKTE